MSLKLATVQESITVNAETPLIESSSSSVGGVVDVNRIESLPLNGRQFANLAATIPGVGLGFHSDPTKSSQYSPQIGGGNGRNVNYQIDGGDNNDDTVGGLLQLFPLEAIQEFNFVTQRYKAEYGRSNGGVMNIVTKSGTNNFSGSAFSLFRDQSLNAQDAFRGAQQRGEGRLSPLSVRRIVRRPDRAEPRVLLRRGGKDAAGHQSDRQHARALPESDGIYPTPVRETLLTVKQTTTLNPSQYLAFATGATPTRGRMRQRCARRQRSGARARTRSTRSTSTTTGCSAARS